MATLCKWFEGIKQMFGTFGLRAVTTHLYNVDTHCQGGSGLISCQAYIFTSTIARFSNGIYNVLSYTAARRVVGGFRILSYVVVFITFSFIQHITPNRAVVTWCGSVVTASLAQIVRGILELHGGDMGMTITIGLDMIGTVVNLTYEYFEYLRVNVGGGAGHVKWYRQAKYFNVFKLLDLF